MNILVAEQDRETRSALTKTLREAFPEAAVYEAADPQAAAAVETVLGEKGEQVDYLFCRAAQQTAFPQEEAERLQVKTFGYFEAFVGGKRLSFRREKAKELLAYLVDRHGASVTTEQIAAVLWEDKPYSRTMKNYVSNVYNSLRRTLEEVGCGDVLIKSRNHLSLDAEKIRCDAYDYEQGDKTARSAFRGEYMSNYSWAEFAVGNYVHEA